MKFRSNQDIIKLKTLTNIKEKVMKQQFDLSLWLQDKSRKIVTRDGRPVRIVCWDSPDKTYPIVGFINNNPAVYTWDNYGYNLQGHIDSNYDLFFADEEPESIEIPFGAKGSEFVRDEYYIPEGCEARIEGNKVIIERIQKEEQLTGFEKELINIVFKYKYWDSSKDKVKQGIKEDSKLLLDLARNEFLKDLPKWKKATEHKEFEVHVCVMDEDMYPYLDTEVNEGEYYIELSDLKTLPKEE